MAKIKKFPSNTVMGMNSEFNPHKARRNKAMPADPVGYKAKMGTSTKATVQKMPKKKQIKGGY